MKEGQGRHPKDRDFLRTREGMFFCVTGYLHPPDRYTAYLKYSPVSEGKWEDDVTAYRRELPYYHVRNVARTIRYLEEHHPIYVDRCPVRDFRFSLVPRECVTQYYVPEERLREIFKGPHDALEEQVRGLVIHLAAAAAVDPRSFGVTGSILIGLHNPRFSDLDLTVYGLDNAMRLRDALRQSGVPRVSPLGDVFIAKWSAGIARRFPLSEEEARYLASRRWNYGYYGERYFSIHPIRGDAEIGERYGDHLYRAQGGARIRALVTDAEESVFMPATYRVSGVRVLEGDADAVEIREIVSHEGLYRDVVDAGEEVEARGTLESVDGVRQRLVIGTLQMGGEGYIKPLNIRSASKGPAG